MATHSPPLQGGDGGQLGSEQPLASQWWGWWPHALPGVEVGTVPAFSEPCLLVDQSPGQGRAAGPLLCELLPLPPPRTLPCELPHQGAQVLRPHSHRGPAHLPTSSPAMEVLLFHPIYRQACWGPEPSVPVFRTIRP